MTARAICLAVLLAAGCSTAAPVEYAGGQCLIDGHPATPVEVEARQASLSERIVARQPLFALVTILLVVLAGASHAEKLILLFSTRGSEARGLGERLRLAIDRYRASPVRYFAIVTATLSLLVLVGGLYVYLDVEKRSNERALGLLQFCHLALRQGEAEGSLAAQRKNLEAIEHTAGAIRALVGELPPAEQEKAQQIVDQLKDALKRQGKLVSDQLAESGAETRAMGVRAAALERGILELRSLPDGMRDVGDRVRAIDGKLTALDTKLGGLDGKFTLVDGKLSTIEGKVGSADSKAEAHSAALDARIAALEKAVLAARSCATPSAPSAEHAGSPTVAHASAPPASPTAAGAEK